MAPRGSVTVPRRLPPSLAHALAAWRKRTIAASQFVVFVGPSLE
jgi:hypothetical protein